MNGTDDYLKPPGERVPDFGWPYRMADNVFAWLSAQWDRLLALLDTGILNRRFPRFLVLGIFWSCGFYFVLLWMCLCYIQYPVSPYGLWDMARWVAGVAVVAFGAVYTLYAGGGMLVLLLWLLLLIAVYFALSLCYVCWVVWGAARTKTLWLKRYRSVMITGLGASLILATFVDGSYRFWDRPFESPHWTKLVFIAASGWAALFCHLVRDKALERETPRRVVKWTVGLTIALGFVGHWAAGSQKAEYFLRKDITEHPNDATAWLNLARHYYDEGDTLASDSGDEDHAPPDPTPFYREALDCLNQAATLGANDFKVHLARAQLADRLGEGQKAASFGRQALDLAPTSSGGPANEEETGVKWLREMIVRNAAAPPESDAAENMKERVRDRRREALPGMMRWVFEVF